MHFIFSRHSQNQSIDINHDHVLDLPEVIGWLLPSKGDFVYEEVDRIFRDFDSDRDWDLNQDEIRSAYHLLLHLLPQSVWTDSSFLDPSDSLVFGEDFDKEEPLRTTVNSSQQSHAQRVSRTSNPESQPSCDRRLPFSIPLLQVCDIPSIR